MDNFEHFEGERKPGWLLIQMEACALRWNAHHKFWHMTPEQLKEFLGDWTPDKDCPYGKQCTWK